MQKYIAAALLAAWAGGAAAEGYVGLAVGQSRFSLDCAGLTRCDESDPGVKFFGGYRYTPMVAAEAAFMDFGRARSADMKDGFMLKGSLSAQALVANAALRVPLSDTVDGVLRLGVAGVRAALRQTADGGLLASRARTSLQPYLGLAVQYRIQPNMSLDLGADATRAKLDGGSGGTATSTVRQLNAGVTVGF